MSIYMKKSTISAILMGIITLMSISICFLIFCIATRPRYITVTEPDSVVITEETAIADNMPTIPSTSPDTAQLPSATEPESLTTMRGKTSTRVNIRNAPSTDAKVLETVDEGTTFDIIEIQDNGWTKVQYQDEEGYISSSYVIIINE